MIMRTLPDADVNSFIQIFLKGIKDPVFVRYTQCDDAVCLAQFSVDKVFNEQVEKRSDVKISYQVKSGQKFSFTAPLKGLSEAIFSLQH
ncbi:invasion associated locus B family protein [Bartonella ancashensis]|uniref:Mll2847-like protein n=1 Tax=Bartonella ancashensis TaxID=1318743 RepID=A0A0M4M767_9HYPH|nr:invasion associated locus B family protein [Bartonella ancashensis]ALE04154.1 Mll2847-like protein [Bartonella ancashensis]